jgi:hypothetical protein
MARKNGKRGDARKGRGGPRTPEGKAVSRYNATKFGIYSESPVLPMVENEKDWQRHREGIFASLQPQNFLEAEIVEQIAVNRWRLKRIIRYEREVVTKSQIDAPYEWAETERLRGHQIPTNVADFDDDMLRGILQTVMAHLLPDEHALKKINRYDGRLHRQTLQLLHELEAMQSRRRGQPANLARIDLHGMPDPD